jgi:hypothetical protein
MTDNDLFVCHLEPDLINQIYFINTFDFYLINIQQSLKIHRHVKI